ncbi:hypothetical protein HYFRA_00009457 [Hymenoscyphus fraxineus]|uniref:G-patch domain-containing protein n=1 Tax=Hymenoscyphus fraxineus TaxID=746836 RepID=A0A9N9PQ86_9HELO|nr:hypothetical protein HYFRA_00009457 [Hymenoscyphus fraxineus]
MSSSTTPPSPTIGAAAVNAANPTTASSATNTTTAPLTSSDGDNGIFNYLDPSRPANVWEGPVDDDTNKMYGSELRRFANECWRRYQDVQQKIDMRSFYPRGLGYLKKMGWSEGTGLGRINQGRLLPLVSKRHDGEGGVGWRAGKPDNINKDPNDLSVKFVNYETPMSSKWGIAKSRLPIPKKQTKGEADAAGIARRKK